MTNRKEFVRHMAERTGRTQSEASELTDAFFGQIIDELRDGGLFIRGFGSFQVADIPEHTTEIPSTGERITIPAQHRCLFRAGSEMKEAIR